MTPASVAVLVLVGGSLFFTGVAALGLVRLPDVYARAHATGKSETLGSLLGLAAAGLVFGPGRTTAKLVALFAFVLLTNPTATHAITRTARAQGIVPWTREHPGKRGDEP